ncbi:PPE family protein [Mycobacterium sp.]|uniref:PPE family protein n=1 Tax=Mycobacterium sp. TaxID=1785 RepID=UPI003BB0CA89
MDFGAFPPEINSARIIAGPGSGPMLAAASAWDTLAAELQSGASSYGSAISELAGEWQGPSSALMEDAATPYVAWLNAAAGQAEQTAAQARAAAGAYQSALTAMVPLPEIAANRTQLAALTATNVFGQNTPAIATTEAQYGEMWAQDATAMYGYAGSSAAAARVTPFTTPPSTTNPAGAASQAAAVTQASGTATGNGVQSALSQLTSTITSALQNLASPAASSTSSTSLLSTLLNDLGVTSTSGTTGIAGLGSTGESLLNTLVTLPISDTAFFGLFTALDAIGPLIGTPMNVALTQAMIPPVAAAGGFPMAAAPMAAAGVGAAAGGLGGFAGLGGLAGLGQAASVGTLSVPQSWGWAATPAAAMMGGVPLASALPGANLGAAGGLPLAAGLPMMGGMGRAAGVAAAAGVGGAVASKYGKPRVVVARPPSAGYPPEPEYASPAAAYPVPAGFPKNGHAPPGYMPAIVYLPTNGHAPPKN